MGWIQSIWNWNGKICNFYETKSFWISVRVSIVPVRVPVKCRPNCRNTTKTLIGHPWSSFSWEPLSIIIQSTRFTFFKVRDFDEKKLYNHLTIFSGVWGSAFSILIHRGKDLRYFSWQKSVFSSKKLPIKSITGRKTGSTTKGIWYNPVNNPFPMGRLSSWKVNKNCRLRGF